MAKRVAINISLRDEAQRDRVRAWCKKKKTTPSKIVQEHFDSLTKGAA